MKINVNKSGSNERGIWVYGTADMGGLQITSLFSTNLQEQPKEGSTLTFKSVKMVNGKNGLYYSITF